MILEICANSDRGRVRSRNEDMILLGKDTIRDTSVFKRIDVNSSERYIVAVADGLGGHKRGDVASEMVLDELSAFFYALPEGLSLENMADLFKGWVQKTHRNVAQKGINNSDFVGMGSTLVSLVFYEGYVFWVNCGDSRIYRLRNGILSQLSKDHTLAAMTGNTHIPSNIITNSIGAGELAYLDMQNMTEQIFSGDRFLLCSDGLSDVLSDEEIENSLIKSTVDQLVNCAIDSGSFDNVSACMVRIEV